MSENSKPDVDPKLLAQLISADILRRLEEQGLQVSVSLHSPALSESACRAVIKEIVALSHESQAKAQKLATLGTMGAGVVHEVRNVLTAVAGFAHVASRPKNVNRREELLETIESETMRAVEMLGHFLAFARNRPKTEKVFSINEVLTRARRATLHQLRVHQVRLKVALIDEDTTLIGAPMEIEQILVNLILNAQQASQGGETVEVSAVVTEGNMLRIAVSDKGSGIGYDDLKEIFDPFFTTKTSGTGLGLAVSKRIAEEHGGSLTVQSALGEGTTFILTLPLAGETAETKV